MIEKAKNSTNKAKKVAVKAVKPVMTPMVKATQAVRPVVSGASKLLPLGRKHGVLAPQDVQAAREYIRE
jgi:hypothetical protein